MLAVKVTAFALHELEVRVIGVSVGRSRARGPGGVTSGANGKGRVFLTMHEAKTPLATRIALARTITKCPPVVCRSGGTLQPICSKEGIHNVLQMPRVEYY